MTDRELLASWDLDILCAKNIGSVTLSKEFILAIDDFINRQKAEIERLEEDIKAQDSSIESLLNIVNSNYQNGRADAVKEFAEMVKEKIRTMSRIVVYDEDIDNLVKEFTEGGKG